MRLLKFIAAFIATALFLAVFIVGLNWEAFNTFLDNREAFMEGTEWVPKTQSLRGLTEFIEENPRHVSVASIVLEHPDSTLFYEADTPRTMGALSNILLLSAYADQIGNGEMDPEMTLELNQINKYRLPQVANSVHKEAFSYAEQQDWLVDGLITLKHALRLLGRFNDPALADFLWWQLDPSAWDELKDRMNLEKTEMPLPFSGLYAAISPGWQDQSFEEIHRTWQNRSRADWRSHVIRLSEQYASDDQVRKNIQEQFRDDRLGISFMQERDALSLFPKTTARELATLLQTLWEKGESRDRPGNTVLDWLRDPFLDRSEIERDFTDYGALFDSRMGLLNGIDFGTLVYTGETKFQAILFDRLPIGFWFHMSGSHMHQDFQQRLIYDPALIDRMEKVAG